MSKLQLVLTSTCNMDCDYCYMTRLCRKDMSKETIRRIFRSFPVTNLSFSGGEPLVRFDLIKYALELSGARKKRIPVTIHSNATLLNKEMLEYFKKHKITIELCLAGTKEVNDRHRKFKDKSGSYETIMRKVGLLKSSGIDFNVNYVVASDSIQGTAKNLLNMIKEFELSAFLGYVFDRKPITNYTVGLFISEIVQFSHLYFKEKLFLNKAKVYPFDDIFFKLLYGSDDNIADLVSSKCRFDKICFYPDGKIYLCPACLVISSNYRKKIELGDLNTQDFDENKLLFFKEKFSLFDWQRKKALKKTNNICYLRCKDPARRYILDDTMKRSILFIFDNYLKGMGESKLRTLRDSCLEKREILCGH